MNAFLQSVRDVLGTELFRLGESPVTLATVLGILVVLVATVWLSRLMRAATARVLTWRGERPAVIGSVTGLVRYAVLVVGVFVALTLVGIDPTALFAAGAIFAVGLGIALQSIVQNFVAGVILLAERAIKPGDILEVEGTLVRVEEMGIRSSLALTRDGEHLVIPNATIIQTTVKNYTLRDSSYRIRASVGVAYGSDMTAVKATLQAVAAEISARWAVPGHEPQVILTEFGTSAVVWEVAIWMSDPWRFRAALSDLHEAIWWALKRAGIVIAFPQVDVHLDAPVVAAPAPRG